MKKGIISIGIILAIIIIIILIYIILSSRGIIPPFFR